ncbi:MAG: glutamine-hydrolyzing carbamoyl-phosphate synthase small subunit [Candidatus Eisenbacteria bacterium]|nr:glutamine-hydrolyzing carbamoyl-phosphate synthase small subunit [Candidatus Eisenbacteria bacterium]MCC7143193.1 glutamine-hydrolyzing carbamoyl-phosphate synthase small subunit [Candidatus Eisenbacteria bacterium]
MRALLALEDGTIFPGRAFASAIAAGGEVVFNTAMTGYQEIITDPSYFGQIVVFTAPHVGNYGVHEGEDESARAHAAGVIVREVCETPAHSGATRSLPDFLREQDRFGLSEVDTRALTLHLRSRGCLRGWLTTAVDHPADAVERARAVPPMDRVPAVASVSTGKAYEWNPGTGGSHQTPRGDRPRIAVLDCGVKWNILRELQNRGCEVQVLPAETSFAELERMGPDGVLLSNGPGDPGALSAWVPRFTRILERYPTLAICLGHQVASLALGCRILKLPFGHHGGNHPVKEIASGRVLITSQNHNYAVDPGHLPEDLSVTHLNLNDGTVEGVRHRSLPLWSLQFHPEAAPGPHDAAGVFNDFVTTIRRS